MFTLSLLALNFANNLDPDEAPQNVGLHLRSKLLDIQIIYRHTKLVGNKDFLQILKKKIFKKNYPACKELKPRAQVHQRTKATDLYLFHQLSAATSLKFKF